MKIQKKTRWRHVLHDLWLNIAAFFLLLFLLLIGILVIRTALIRNAWETGSTLAHNYATEEQSSLAVYETLLSIGTASADRMQEENASKEELTDWMRLFADRMATVLGEGAVDPYLVVNGEIVAANPWEGDEGYDVASTSWYQMAIEADGNVIFTSLYTDAISQKQVITVAQKCRNSDAVMAFDIFPENFSFRFDSLEGEAGDSFFLCDSTGALIYMQSDYFTSSEEAGAYLEQVIQKIKNGELDSYSDYIVDTNGRQRAVYYSMMDNGWISIVTIPYENILEDFNWFTLLCILIVIVYLVALVGMAWREVKNRARIDRTNETVRVLGNSYYALYRIDYRQNTYEMIKGSDYVRSRIPEKGPYPQLQKVIGEVIEPEAFEDFMRSFDRENIQKLVSQRIRDFGGDFLRRFNGVYRWVSVRVLFDESLAPNEVVLSFREVEQEKQKQLQEHKLLEDALAVARQNEKAKQAFFSNMSHDMRTPLNAIIGLSELAEEHVNEPQRMAEYLKKINTSSHQLLNLINDILDMSRMEQGKVVLNNRQINIKDCVEDCLDAFRFQAEQEKKSLKISIDVQDPCIYGDSFRITQILNNLLSNALKFTSEGDSVSFTLQQMDRGEYAKFKFVVADTGIGISKEFLPHLFEPYMRELRFSAKQAAGTGLGMPITHNLVVQMNGEIQVESEPGKGSVFTVVLPFVLAENEKANVSKKTTEEPDKPDLQALTGRRILLAEDNEVNMEITTELLAMNDVQVVQAWNGAEAVERFSESEPFTFDAILMDIQMPEMDGCEAAKKIRALHRPDARKVPIIAVTANAFAEDIAATTAAGMNAHVSKPIDFSILCKTLGRLMEKRPDA